MQGDHNPEPEGLVIGNHHLRPIPARQAAQAIQQFHPVIPGVGAAIPVNEPDLDNLFDAPPAHVDIALEEVENEPQQNPIAGDVPQNNLDNAIDNPPNPHHGPAEGGKVPCNI